MNPNAQPIMTSSKKRRREDISDREFTDALYLLDLPSTYNAEQLEKSYQAALVVWKGINLEGSLKSRAEVKTQQLHAAYELLSDNLRLRQIPTEPLFSREDMHEFRLDEIQADENHTTALPLSNLGSFWLAKNGLESGPFSEDQVWSMFKSGLITREDSAWREGMNGWSTVQEVLVIETLCPETVEPERLTPSVTKSRQIWGYLAALATLIVGIATLTAFGLKAPFGFLGILIILVPTTFVFKSITGKHFFDMLSK